MLTKKILSVILISLMTVAILNTESRGAGQLRINSNGLWVIEQINGGKPGFLAGQSIQFHKDGKLSVHVDCNHTVADYTINRSNNSIRVSGMITTSKNCEGAMSQVPSIRGMIRNSSSFQIHGQKLLLVTNDGQRLAFQFRPHLNDNKLVGKKWTLILVGIIKGMVMSTRVEMILRFDNKGFTARTACQVISGDYVRSGKTLKFKNIKMTTKRCARFQEEEKMVARLLVNSDTFQITNGQTLEIFNQDKKSLMFNAR